MMIKPAGKGWADGLTPGSTQPQLLATAAADASEISSAISEARRPPPAPQPVWWPLAQDEVSMVAATFPTHTARSTSGAPPAGGGIP